MNIRVLDLNISRMQRAVKYLEKELLSRKIQARVVSVPEHLEVYRKGHNMDNSAIEIDGLIVYKGLIESQEAAHRFFNIYFEKYAS